MRTGWKSYFVFTKRERVGIVVLMVLIVMVAVLPLFFAEPISNTDKLEWERYRKELAATDGRSDRRSSEDGVDEVRDEGRRDSSEYKEEFFFDPNNVSENDWKRLGIRDRTIQTIHRFLGKGGQFRNPEDLGRIYGIDKRDYDRLLPFVRIKGTGARKDIRHDKEFSLRKEYTEKNRYEERNYERKPPGKKIFSGTIDINHADSATLMSLPGIGRVIANRIIRFRERLGGFYQVDQIKEVYGISDSTFQLIRSAFVCNLSDIQKIKLNTCQQAELSRHPYVQYKLAALIIEYRNQHGSFRNKGDLMKIENVGADKFQKLEPYLTID